LPLATSSDPMSSIASFFQCVMAGHRITAPKDQDLRDVFS
jgi:hypothetical protein